MQKEKKKSKSIFENKTLTVVLVLIVLLIIYFAINLIPTNITEPIKTDINKQTDSGITFKKQGSLSFISKEGKVLSNIDVEFADDNFKRMQGLMYRKEMAENQGMLFIFEIEDYQSFWMKNTILPLDIIFVNVNKEIVKIHKNTTPFSEQSYSSGKPALYVVEVNAGYTDKYGIKEGDKISWVYGN